MHQFIDQTNTNVVNKVDHDILKIQFFGSKNLIERIIEMIKHLPIKIIKMNDNFVEIINQNVSKGAAIKIFCDLLQISLKKTASIGDSFNDLEMLKTTPISYAMGNGHFEILKTARFKTDHVLKNGVGKALHDFLKKQQKD